MINAFDLLCRSLDLFGMDYEKTGENQVVLYREGVACALKVWISAAGGGLYLDALPDPAPAPLYMENMYNIFSRFEEDDFGCGYYRHGEDDGLFITYRRFLPVDEETQPYHIAEAVDLVCIFPDLHWNMHKKIIGIDS